MSTKIENYGWVPFPYFQHVLLASIVFSFYNYKKINDKLRKYIYDPLEKKYKNDILKKSVKVSIALFTNISNIIFRHEI